MFLSVAGRSDETQANQDLSNLRQTVYLAEKVEGKLGPRPVLQQALPQ
ncbi:MAG: hypothetical protein AAF394_04755 [Planctomycetota bacterium]